MLLKCFTQYASKFGKLSSDHRTGKRQFHSNPKERQCQRILRRTVQKGLNDPDNHDGVVTHLEPDILECEVKWALESITMNKASEGDGFQLSYFKF